MRLKSVLTTIFVALMLIVGVDYVSFAATGQSLLLGKANSANAATGLTRTTSGPVLSLNATAGSPPLKVNRTTKVTSLNADLLDGVDSSKFARKQAPFRVFVAPALDGRTMSIADQSSVAVQTVTTTVPAECGTSTRHRYLAEYSAWVDSDGQARTSIALDSTAVYFGESFRIVTTGRNVVAGSRVLTLAPGSHSISFTADRYAGTYGSVGDPALMVTDLGYTCSGGTPTTRSFARTGNTAGAGLG